MTSGENGAKEGLARARKESELPRTKKARDDGGTAAMAEKGFAGVNGRMGYRVCYILGQ
jgi:hypothetical protein